LGPSQDLTNQKNHGVSFQEASDLFTSGADYLELFDDAHSDDEDRFIAIGPIRRGLVLVVWTERDEDVVRSSPPAEQHDRSKLYFALT
jgi:uncharacterized DUF497 family protein